MRAATTLPRRQLCHQRGASRDRTTDLAPWQTAHCQSDIIAPRGCPNRTGVCCALPRAVLHPRLPTNAMAGSRINSPLEEGISKRSEPPNTFRKPCQVLVNHFKSIVGTSTSSCICLRQKEDHFVFSGDCRTRVLIRIRFIAALSFELSWDSCQQLLNT